MTKRAWFKSLLFPVLSILGSMAFLLMGIANHGFFVAIAILGFVGGGIVPYVMIVRNRLDLSMYFPAKIILFSALAVGGVLTWTVFDAWLRYIYPVIVLPLLMIAAEIVYAARQKTDRKTKICLALSSLAWGYLGFGLDALIVLVWMRSFY